MDNIHYDISKKKTMATLEQANILNEDLPYKGSLRVLLLLKIQLFTILTTAKLYDQYQASSTISI